MAGYWPSSLFAFSCRVFFKNVKRERGQYPAILTELAWSIKDLLHGIRSTEKSDPRLFPSTEKQTSLMVK